MILVTKGDSYREFTIKGVNYAIKTEMQKVADVDDHDDDGHSHHVSIFCSQLEFAPSFNNFIALHLYVLYICIFDICGEDSRYTLSNNIAFSLNLLWCSFILQQNIQN